MLVITYERHFLVDKAMVTENNTAATPLLFCGTGASDRPAHLLCRLSLARRRKRGDALLSLCLFTIERRGHAISIASAAYYTFSRHNFDYHDDIRRGDITSPSAIRTTAAILDALFIAFVTRPDRAQIRTISV